MDNVDKLVLDISDVNELLYVEDTILKQEIDLRKTQLADLISQGDVINVQGDIDSLESDVVSLEDSVGSLTSISDIAIDARVNTIKEFETNYGYASGKKFLRIFHTIYELSNSYSASSFLTDSAPALGNSSVKRNTFRKIQAPIYVIPFETNGVLLEEPMGTYQYNGGIYFTSYHAEKTGTNSFLYKVYRTDLSFKSTSYLSIAINTPIGNDGSFNVGDKVPLVAGFNVSRDGKIVYLTLFDNTILRYSVDGDVIGRQTGPIATSLDDIWTDERDDPLYPVPPGADMLYIESSAVANVTIDSGDDDIIYVMGVNLTKLQWDGSSLATVGSLTDAAIGQGTGSTKKSLHQSYMTVCEPLALLGPGTIPDNIADTINIQRSANTENVNLLLAIVEEAVIIVDGDTMTLARTIPFDVSDFDGPNLSFPYSTSLKSFVANDAMDYGIWVTFNINEYADSNNYMCAFLYMNMINNDLASLDNDIYFSTVTERHQTLSLGEEYTTSSAAYGLSTINDMFINNNGFLDVTGVTTRSLNINLTSGDIDTFVFQNIEVASDIKYFWDSSDVGEKYQTANWVVKGITHIETKSGGDSTYENPFLGKNRSQLFQVGNRNSNSLLYKEMDQ